MKQLTNIFYVALITICIPLYAANTIQAIKDTITQSTISILREYEVPRNARVKIKAKQEELDIFMFESASAAKEAITTVTPQKILKPLASILSPLLNLFSSPSKIILKAQVSLFGSVQEPFITYQDRDTFIIQTNHTHIHNCTIIAPMKHFLIVESLGTINFSSQYAAVDSYAPKITINASHQFKFKNDPKDFYKHAIGTLNTLAKVHCEPTQVILRSDKGEVVVNELAMEN